MRLYEDLRGLQRRLTIIQAVVIGAMVLVTGYFWHLQVLRGRYYRELAENNRLRTVPIPAPRGPLFDRSGRILAENRSSFNVVLTTEHLRHRDESLRHLRQLLDIDVEAVQQRLNTKGPKFRSVVVKADASEGDVATVEARRLERPEMSVEVVPLRSYPLAEAAAHSLGHVGEITDRQMEHAAFEGIEAGTVVGQAGLELEYNRQLMGRDGVRRIVVNSRGVEVAEAEREAPVDGPSAQVSLDIELQQAFEEAMAGEAGSVVVLEPETGEVLAYLSNPAYDPNAFSLGIEPELWAHLNKDPEKPLINRPIQGTYPPGSTFKILNALAALQENVIARNTRFHCPGYLAVYGTVFRCHKEEGHGTLNLERAIALSCNVYFYNVGIRLEIERLSRYAKMMGFAAKSGVDLPHEVSGLFQDPEWKQRALKTRWYPSETVSVSIGQAMSVTPMQMARVAAVVANGGRLVRPHFMRKIGGQPVNTEHPKDLGFKPSVVDAVREAMLTAVREGTGQRAKLLGLAVGGKTGSAQVVTSARLASDKKARKNQPHGWFIFFAPARGGKPAVAGAVLVEHGVAGGQSAAPVVGRALARYHGVPAIGPGMTPPPDTIPSPPQPEAVPVAFVPDDPPTPAAPSPAPPPP
ncbi:MAG TPA: penicillin-binding protein 2 [Vicinamibacteria bacterium]|nr:penicillin-binding protein 2 [Vicinamibacteria bacterium]